MTEAEEVYCIALNPMLNKKNLKPSQEPSSTHMNRDRGHKRMQSTRKEDLNGPTKETIHYFK